MCQDGTEWTGLQCRSGTVNQARRLVITVSKVKYQGVTGFCQGQANGCQAVRMTIMINMLFGFPNTIRQGPNSIAKHDFRIPQAIGHDVDNNLCAIFIEQLCHPTAHDACSGNLSPEIKFRQCGSAGICHQRRHHFIGDLSIPNDTQETVARCLLKGIICIQIPAARHRTSDIGMMDHRAGPGDKRAINNDRCDQCDIVLMHRPHPGIIRDEHIPITQFAFANDLHTIFDDMRQGRDMRQDRHPAGNQFAFCGGDPNVVILDL